MGGRLRVAFALALMLLTACEGDPGGDASSTASPALSPSASPAETSAKPVAGINQRKRADLSVGGVIRVGVTRWTEDWNPLTRDLPDQLAVVAWAWSPRLMDVAADGELTPNPDWLDGAPDVSHEGATVVTYHLNPRAVWGDRAPVTAADFAATWQACLDPGRACATGRGFEAVVAVEEGATASDVVVTYDRVYAEWALTFQDGPVRAEAAGEVWRDPSEHPEWFAGPYKVAFLDQSARKLTLERNPYWWGDRGLLAEVDVEQVTAEALALAGAAEELDAWPIEADARRHQAAAALSGVQLRRADSATWRVLVVGQSGALADSRVRRAVRLGLDRALIGSADLPGVGWDARPLNHLFWQSGQDAYTDLTEGVATDLTQAGALLDAAGFPVRSDASRAVELRFLVNPADPLSEGEGLQVAAQLRALGVGVTLVYPEHGWPEGRVCAAGCAVVPGGYADALAGGGVDLVAQAWTNELQPEVTWGAWLGSNHLGYSNAVVEQLLATAAATANEAGRAWRLDVAAASLWADTTVIPLYVVPETWAVRSDLANFGPSGLATLRWQDVGLV